MKKKKKSFGCQLTISERAIESKRLRRLPRVRELIHPRLLIISHGPLRRGVLPQHRIPVLARSCIPELRVLLLLLRASIRSQQHAPQPPRPRTCQPEPETTRPPPKTALRCAWPGARSWMKPGGGPQEGQGGG